jgi:hypothetical protein
VTCQSAFLQTTKAPARFDLELHAVPEDLFIDAGRRLGSAICNHAAPALGAKKKEHSSDRIESKSRVAISNNGELVEAHGQDTSSQRPVSSLLEPLTPNYFHLRYSITFAHY